MASGAIYALSAAMGILAFASPFLTAAQTGTALSGAKAALAMMALIGLSLVALLIEMQGRSLDARTVALLGVLVATTSVLRFVEVILPMPGGFSPVFVPIILAGYVFGARFGFLMGAFTLLVSAMITGGVGPWLPYQMYAAGWVGMTAGWLGRAGGGNRAMAARSLAPRHLILLAVFSFAWGFLYGAIMNVYFWPYAVGSAEQSWAAGIGFAEMLSRYAAFYAVTSLGWDLLRAIGNVVLILLLASPTVRVLQRFRQRFHFAVQAAHD
ncbi:MAG: ECF transporter S component [Anaerolineae bacterium]|nr:ECF transporter S component [Anaerolineae bacterium]